VARDLPINARIVEQLAKATVKNIIDGLVELITNCDDSYSRMEGRGATHNGKILISVDREKGGICNKLVVQDFAEGMKNDELEKAIVFGGETSGFAAGRSVRGLFGRGLKETIIALGEGEISTVKDNNLVRTRLWFDKKARRPLYDDEMLSERKYVSEHNGTKVEIKITNEKIKTPELETFKSHLTEHFALRDIASSDRREIILEFEDLRRKLKTTEPVRFDYPYGKLTAQKELNLPGFGDPVQIKIFESPSSLSSPRNNPYGLAGILIKTKSAVLDNQLFKFENEPAALYFFGEALCGGIEERLRKGETEIIDPNRGGLEWRNDYCQALMDAIEKILEPLVNKKKKSLEKKPEKEVTQPTKKMLRNLCSVLNRIAKQELEDIPEFPADPEPDIETLMVKPEQANIEEGKIRNFSIYAPTSLIERQGTEASIEYDNWAIKPLSSQVSLERHSKYPDKIWYKYFKVAGKKKGEKGCIIVSLGTQTARAHVKVGALKKRRKGSIMGRKGGFISEIKPDELSNPARRVVYYDGIIRVYVKFPSVSKFIGSGLEGVETTQGRLLLSELVGDAFCRTLARQGMKYGKYPKGADEVESFNSALDELQKKYLHEIQKVIFAWKF